MESAQIIVIMGNLPILVTSIEFYFIHAVFDNLCEYLKWFNDMRI